MFLPVGKTPGLRIGSPPGPGSMYCPSKASTNAPSSLSATTCLKQRFEHLVLRRLHKTLGRQRLAVGRLAEHPA